MEINIERNKTYKLQLPHFIDTTVPRGWALWNLKVL